MSSPRIPAVLTIAGSDSGGGAGIQADLQTFAAFGVFGASAITCLTAQNPAEVAGILPVDPEMVRLQIRTVCRGFPVAAAKTGMLYSAAIIRAVAVELKAVSVPQLVVDPVMVATSGARLLQERAVAVLCQEVLPLATVVTPNLPEAEIIAHQPIRDQDSMAAAAQKIAAEYGIACVIKGGHLTGAAVRDVLCVDGRVETFVMRRAPARETHGTGCVFSAALAALLAGGASLPAAVPRAQRFVAAALSAARPVGRHYPLRIAPPR